VARLEGFGAAGMYFGTIQAAVNARLSTQELYSALYNSALELTGQVPKFGFAEVTALRSQAVKNREAEAAFARLPSSGALGPEHFGATPRAAAFQSVRDPRRILAVFEHIVERGGVQYTETRTSEFIAGVGPTKGSVLNDLSRNAAELSKDYEDEVHIGIGAVRLLAA
jgi:hypothetical protein